MKYPFALYRMPGLNEVPDEKFLSSTLAEAVGQKLDVKDCHIKNQSIECDELRPLKGLFHIVTNFYAGPGEFPNTRHISVLLLDLRRTE